MTDGLYTEILFREIRGVLNYHIHDAVLLPEDNAHSLVFLHDNKAYGFGLRGGGHGFTPQSIAAPLQLVVHLALQKSVLRNGWDYEFTLGPGDAIEFLKSLKSRDARQILEARFAIIAALEDKKP